MGKATQVVKRWCRVSGVTQEAPEERMHAGFQRQVERGRGRQGCRAEIAPGLPHGPAEELGFDAGRRQG